MNSWLPFNPSNSSKREHWQRLQSKGKKNFVLRAGVMQFGGFMFVVTTALDLIHKSPLPRRPIDYIVLVAANLLIWSTAGYCFGLGMWAFCRGRFSDGSKTR
jgi:hypothetical protein